jgi:hypothetical protein
MLRDYLISAIRTSFPSLPFVLSESSNPVATLRAPFAEIGELQIYDDGDEATVVFSKVTHGHFGSYDSSLSAEKKELEIVQNVINFLQALFADKVLLFCTPSGSKGFGGWQKIDPSQEPLAFKSKCEYFVWSGSYDSSMIS